MASLDITRNYTNGEPLLEADLDALQTAVTTMFNTTGISDDNVQNNSLTASAKLIAASVTTTPIADSAISSAKIADLNVTTAKINDGAVTTAKILDANVTTAKILDANVTAAKIASSAVTVGKRAAVGNQTSSTATLATNGTSETDITNLTVSFTATGKPVSLLVQPTSAATTGLGTPGFYTSGFAYFRLYRDATCICTYRLQIQVYMAGPSGPGTRIDGQWGMHLPVSALYYIDQPSAGTYTYKWTVQSYAAQPNFPTTTDLGATKLVAFEMI